MIIVCSTNLSLCSSYFSITTDSNLSDWTSTCKNSEMSSFDSRAKTFHHDSWAGSLHWHQIVSLAHATGYLLWTKTEQELNLSLSGSSFALELGVERINWPSWIIVSYLQLGLRSIHFPAWAVLFELMRLERYSFILIDWSVNIATCASSFWLIDKEKLRQNLRIHSFLSVTRRFSAVPVGSVVSKIGEVPFTSKISE